MKSIIWITIITMLLSTSCSSNADKITYPKDLKTFSLNDSIKFDQKWYDYKYKIIVYSNGSSTHLIKWAKPIEKFPEIAFLFYIDKKDSTKIKKRLKEREFYWPVFYDPESKFLESNKIKGLGARPYYHFIFAIKDDKIIDRAKMKNNPTFPEDFEKYLNNFLSEN